MVVNTYNPSICEAEAGGSGHSWLHGESEICLEHRRPSQKKKKSKEVKVEWREGKAEGRGRKKGNRNERRSGGKGGGVRGGGGRSHAGGGQMSSDLGSSSLAKNILLVCAWAWDSGCAVKRQHM